MATNPAQQLISQGQSVWYDNIGRDMLQNGALKKMITDWGVRGLTSNPTIFEQALKTSKLYDPAIAKLKAPGVKPETIFDELALQDIADAADLLRPVYDSSSGNDGFVSIEVSPLLARDTKGTTDEAKRLNARLGRPNVMIKIPGTSEGLPAVRAVLEEGINVNITLLFSVENYVAVAQTYCDALRARVKKGLPVDKIRSVASFFVSRVDTLGDKMLNEIIAKNAGTDLAKRAEGLLGKFGIANSKLAYKRYQQIFETDKFADLKAKGAAVQRPLWASTSTKNPSYRDVMYVEQLIGRETVNTMPHATLEAFVDHGIVAETVTKGVADAERIPSQLEELGISVKGLLDELQVDGVKKFSDSFVSLNQTIAAKLA